MLTQINKNKVPKAWLLEYAAHVATSVVFSSWMNDFIARIKNFDYFNRVVAEGLYLLSYLSIYVSMIYLSICSGVSESNASIPQLPGLVPYWLGGLFSPDAFITATRQVVSQVLNYRIRYVFIIIIYEYI